MEFKRVYQYNPFTRTFDSVRKYKEEVTETGGATPHEFSVTSTRELSSITINIADILEPTAVKNFTFTQSDLLNGNASWTLTHVLGWNILTQRTPTPLEIGGDAFQFIISFVSIGGVIRFKVEDVVLGVSNTRAKVNTYTANFI